ncbi:PPT1, partial [Symbiodinium sp. KB8]
RLRWLDAQTFGRVGRIAFRTILQHGMKPGRRAQTQLTTQLRDALTWVLENVPNAQPRAFHAPKQQSVNVFTDGSFEQGVGQMGGVLCDSTGWPKEWFQASVPPDVLRSWGSDGTVHPILQCELLAVSIAAMVWGPQLSRQNVTWWIDNDAARHCLISAKGYPESNRLLVQAVLVVEYSHEIHSWFARVPSISNPADAPSRGEQASFLSGAKEEEIKDSQAERQAALSKWSQVSSLRRFAAWTVKSFPREPLSESLVFLYCQHVSRTQPDSSAPDQLCQALNFADGVLVLQAPAKELLSQRVQGLAHQCMRKQKPPKQAAALTTEQVLWLQTVAESDDAQYERYIAATFLFMLYARARHSDIRRCREILVDSDADGNPVYIECQVLNPKQTKASQRRNLFLPLVAPAAGIAQTSWALEWLQLRRHLGLVCHGSIVDSPLLPELAADGSLLQTNMDAATASRWLRCLLSKQPGCSPDALLKCSSQGLKATCLSWCMKFPVSDSDQTLLGYHSRGKSASALSYGRDALAGPLRSLEQVLSAVRKGEFKPDSTRSGRWQQCSLTQSSAASSSSVVPASAVPDTALPSTVSDSDSSESAQSSSASSNEEPQQLQSVSHSLALVAGDPGFQFLSNVKSGIVHISRVNDDRLLCGRTVFSSLQKQDVVDFSHTQACITCQSVADGLIAGQWAAIPSNQEVAALKKEVEAWASKFGYPGL